MKKYLITKLLFLSAVLGLGVSNAQVITSASSVNMSFLDQYFNLEVSVSYNRNSYKDYRIEFESQAQVDMSSVSIDSKNSVASQKSFVSTGKYSFSLDNQKLDQANSGSSSSATPSLSVLMSNFINKLAPSCTSSSNTQIVFRLYAKPISGSAETLLGFSNTTVNMPTQTGQFDLYIGLGLTNQLSANYPLVLDVRPYASKNYNVDLTIEYPNDVEVLSVFKYDNTNFNSSQVSYTTVSTTRLNYSSIKISAYGVDIYEYNNILKVYLKPKVNSANLGKSIYVNSYAGNNPSCSQASASKDNSILIDGTVYNTTLLYPYFYSNFLPNNYCKSRCDFNYTSTSFTYSFEGNNVYMGSNQTGRNIKLTNISGVVLQSFAIKGNQYPNNVFPTVQYKLVGVAGLQTLTRANDIYSFGSNGVANVEYLLISNLGLNSYEGKDFSLTFAASNFSYVNEKFKLEYLTAGAGELAYNTGDINIGYYVSRCQSGKYLQDYYWKNGWNWQIFSQNASSYVLLELRPYEHNVPGLYEFDNITYELNSNMSFANSTLKVLKSGGNSGVLNDFVLFSKTSQFPDFAQGISSSNIKIQGNKIVINGVKINYNLSTQTCSAKTIYIMAEVKLKDRIAACNGNGYCYISNFTYPPTGGFNSGYSYWGVSGDFINLISSANLNCSGQDYQSGNVRKDEEFVYRYIFDNSSSEALKDLDIKVQPLKFNDGYQDIVLSYIGNVSAYTLDPVSGIKLNQNALKNNQPVLNAVYQLNTIDGFQLRGYDKLYVEFKYKITDLRIKLSQESVPSNVTAQGTKVNNNTVSSISESKPVQVTISTNSVCIDTPPCAECITSLSPLPGQRYVLSAWVKESYAGILPKTYVNSGVRITFNNGAIADLRLFRPKGPVVDGWQRIDSSFVVPNNANNIQIELVNESEQIQVYFDDVRIHPFRSNMKSFVYDPSSQRLVAELDENNYATQYEYDDEGILIRVKKETERGVMTIKESRNNQSKIFK